MRISLWQSIEVGPVILRKTEKKPLKQDAKADNIAVGILKMTRSVLLKLVEKVGEIVTVVGVSLKNNCA
jgi:hypothetical protein